MTNCEAFRVVPHNRVTLAGGSRLLIDMDGNACALTSREYALLSLFASFTYLSDIKPRISSVVPGASIDESISTINDLAAKGLLMSRSNLMSGDHRDEKRRRLTSVGVISANRPAECSIQLLGLLRHAEEESLDRVSIYDGSADRRHEPAYTECLRGSTRGGVPLVYVGSNEKDIFIRRLAEVGIDPSIASFAIKGLPGLNTETYGANRNTCLLDTVGEAIIMTDDDIVWRAAVHPDYLPMLRLNGHTFPRDVWVFPSRLQAIEWSKWKDLNIIREHAVVLGQTVRGLVAEYKARGVISNPCDHLVASLGRGNARVRMSSPGIVGDSASRSGRWAVYGPQKLRDELATDEKAYICSRQSREICSIASSATITDCGPYMAYNIGLDNTTFLPPFFPLGRGEDEVFGTLFRHCMRDAFVGHLPFAVLHNAESGRTYVHQPEIRICEVIVGITSSLRVPSSFAPIDALRFIGTFIEQIGSLPIHDCVSTVCGIVKEHYATKYLAQSSYPEEAVLPLHIKKDLCQWHLQAVAMLEQRNSHIPIELAGLSNDDAQAKLKDILTRAGQLFKAWPDLLEAARLLKRREIRISRCG